MFDANRKKAPLDYQTLKRYDVVKVSNTERLIFPVVEGSTSIRYYITNAEIFNIIHDVHVQIGHGGPYSAKSTDPLAQNKD